VDRTRKRRDLNCFSLNLGNEKKKTRKARSLTKNIKVFCPSQGPPQSQPTHLHPAPCKTFDPRKTLHNRSNLGWKTCTNSGNMYAPQGSLEKLNGQPTKLQGKSSPRPRKKPRRQASLSAMTAKFAGKTASKIDYAAQAMKETAAKRASLAELLQPPLAEDNRQTLRIAKPWKRIEGSSAAQPSKKPRHNTCAAAPPKQPRRRTSLAASASRLKQLA